MADDQTGNGPKDDAPNNGPTGSGPNDDAPTNGPDNGAEGGDADGARQEPADGNDRGNGGNDDGGGSDGGDDPRVKRANGQAAESRRKLRDEQAARQRIERELEEARAAAGERDTLKETLDGLRKYLDPNAKDDEPVDPEELTRKFETERSGWQTERDELQSEVRQLRVQSALPSLLDNAKLDNGLAMAVLKSEGTLARLDPEADTFRDDAKAAVDKLAEDHPRLKVTREGPRRSGTEPTGPTTGNGQLTLEQYKNLSMEEKEKAQKAGRLRNILSGG